MAGCPSPEQDSTPRKQSRACVKRPPRPGGTSRHYRSVHSPRRLMRRFSPNTVQPASTARSFLDSRSQAAPKSSACSTGTRDCSTERARSRSPGDQYHSRVISCMPGKRRTISAAVRRKLRQARVARLATFDARGRPHIVPICFAYDGKIFLHGGRPETEAGFAGAARTGAKHPRRAARSTPDRRI